MLRKFTLYICSLLLVTVSLQGQVMEGFDYPVSNSIAGNGMAGDGWSSGWVAVSDMDSSAILPGGIFNDSLLVRTATNRAVVVSTTAQNRYDRYLTDPIGSADGDFWFSVHLAIDGNPAGNVGTMVLLDTLQGNAERVVIGKRFGNRNVFATGVGSGATNTGELFEGIAGRWLVGHMVYNTTNSNWELDLWVDPDPGTTPQEADAQIINKVYNDATFNGVRIKSEGAPGILFSVDDIFLGSAFAEIVPDDLISIEPTPLGAIENMNYPAGEGLENQSGGTGWDSDWTLITGTDPTITAGGITSTLLDRMTSGNKVEASANMRMVRSLDGEYGDVGRTFWVGWWFQTQDAGPNVSHLILANEDAFMATGPNGRLAQIGSGFNAANIGIVGGGTTNAASAEGHFVVLEVVTNGAPENDQLYLYIDPDLTTQPDRADADATAMRNLTNWNAIGLIVEGDPGVTAMWDDIYVGNSYAEIVPGDLIDTSIPMTAIAFDQFDYSAGEDLFMLGNMSDGWAGAWDTIATDTMRGKIVTGGLVNDELLARTSSNSFQGESVMGANNRFVRYFDTPINPTDNAEFWFSTHMAVGGNVGNNVGTTILVDTTQENYERIIIGKRFGNRNLFVTGPGSGPTNSGQFFESTSARWVVGQLVASDTSDNWILHLWVDPDPTMVPDTADADIKDKLFPLANFNGVSLKTEGDAGLYYEADDIFVGGVFTDVVPADLESVPEAPMGAVEPMTYPVDEGLDGQDGGTGWDGAWVLEQDNDPTITEGGIDNFVLLKGTSTNKATFTSNGQLERVLEGTYGDVGRSFWVGWWFDSENGGPNVTNLVLADSENFPGGAGELLQIGRSFNGDVLRIIGQGQTTAAADEGHFVVLELVTNGTADNDQVYMWVDPALDRTPLRDTAEVVGTANLTNWNAIGLKVAGDPGVTAEWDDIYVGREYRDVVPVDLEDVQSPDVPVVAYEPFEYPIGEDLDGQDGGQGWLAPWMMQTGTITIAPGSIESDRVEGMGNKASIDQSGAEVIYTRPFFARFAADSPNKREVWLSFLLDVTQNSIGNSADIAIMDGDTEILAVGPTTGLGNIAVTYNGNAPVVSANQSVEGVNWVVVKLDLYGTGVTDSAYVWVNPLSDVLPDPANAEFTITDLEADNGFDRLRLRASGAQDLEMFADEIYVGFEYRDVSPGFGSDDPDLLAYEPFNYDAGETLFGQGGINAFWDGVWMNAGNFGSMNNLEITPGSTALPGFETIGNKAEYSYLEDGTQIRADRELAFPLESDGRTYWVTFFMNTTEGDATNNVGNVTLRNPDIGAAAGQRLAIGRLFGEGKLGFVTPATGNARPTEVDDSGLHWLVTRISTNADPTIPDTVWMWIDPSPQFEPDTATALVSGVSDFMKAGPIPIIRIRTEGASGNETPYITNFDELRIATAWESAAVLTHVIEPEADDVFYLSAFPNPFRDNLNIGFRAPNTGRYTLQLFDVQGQQVATVFDGQLPSGEHQVEWAQTGLPNGFYFLRIVHGEQSTVRKVILFR